MKSNFMIASGNGLTQALFQFLRRSEKQCDAWLSRGIAFALEGVEEGEGRLGVGVVPSPPGKKPTLSWCDISESGVIMATSETEWTTSVSRAGQVTLPAALLRRQRIASGERLLVVPVRDGLLLPRRPDSLVDALAGAAAGTYGDPDEYALAERTEWT